jgi:hypothetical protein
VRWVSEQTKSTSFAKSASAFVCDISRRLKMDGDLSISRMPDPDAETAWRYTKGKRDMSLHRDMAMLLYLTSTIS